MKAFCLLSAALLVPLGAALAAPSATIEPDAPLRSEARTVVRIGLLDFESEASYLSRRENIQETIVRHLQENSPGLRIVPRFYTTEALSEAARKGEVEFFLGSSGFFVQMRPMGARDIGTITSRAFPDPNRCVAGVIVVRSGRPDITDLASLEGMTAVTTSRANFMTYMLNMGEIAAAGFRPDKFFSAVTETDNRPVEVLRAVVEGRADAGLLRACMPEAITERHPEFAGRWTVVNDKPGLRAEALGCRYSTDMYPGWTIASVPHTPPVITKHVAMLLLNLRPDMTPGGFTVSIATEFDRVNDLFRSLKAGPFAYLNHWTLERIWDEARWTWTQHTGWRIDAKSNKDIFYLSVFDNGDARGMEQPALPEMKYSRAVIYKIDQKKMTIQQVWEYGKERGFEWYSPITSVTEYQADKNSVFVYSATASLNMKQFKSVSPNPVINEFKWGSTEPSVEIVLKSTMGYRALPISLDKAFSR